MRGIVTFFNVAASIGFIRGEDGVQYFVHESKVKVEGLRLLLPGWDVNFTPEEGDGDKGPQAINVFPSFDKPGLTVRQGLKAVQLAKDGIASIEARMEGERPAVRFVAVNGKAVEPEEEAEDVTAYRVNGRVNNFLVTASVPTRKWLILILNREDKKPQDVASDQCYTGVEPGAYMMFVDKTGHVVVWTIGRRVQSHGGPHGLVWENWVTIQKRYEYRYEIATGAPSLEEQTPEQGIERLDRLNKGFVPAIRAALEALARLNADLDVVDVLAGTD